MSPTQRRFILAILLSTLTLAPAFAQQDTSTTLSSLEQTAHMSVSDINRLHIDKWKTDGTTKRNAQSDSESIQRNLNSALPELIGKVRTAPDDLNANFQLYRNLNALYDVFSHFAETAGAFGNKDDFQALAKDVDGIDSARRAMGERMDALTTASQAELTQYRSQAKQAKAAAAAAPPKKIVIDDSEPEKKPAKKKKPAAKPANSGEQGANSGSAPKQ